MKIGFTGGSGLRRTLWTDFGCYRGNIRAEGGCLAGRWLEGAGVTPVAFLLLIFF